MKRLAVLGGFRRTAAYRPPLLHRIASMPLVEYFLAPLAFVGHVVIWSRIFNYLHALDMPCRIIRALGKSTLLFMLLIPAAYAYRYVSAGAASPDAAGNAVAIAYFAPCAVIGLIQTLRRLAGRRKGRGRRLVLSNDTTTVDVARQLGRRPAGSLLYRSAAALPGNQILQLNIQRKVIAPARLPPALDGLAIAHLSDLHLTGRLTRDFFEFVVDQTNQLDADLVAVTGDILETERCLDWIPHTLGRLQSRYGAYFVLGNHDKRLGDVSALRRALTDAGLVHLGGRRLEADVRGEPLILAGNELPWFGPPPPMEDCPRVIRGVRPLRVLLSHSPDQIERARSFDFDLMLAGHTHGGQIRFPVLGPLVVPSRYGAKYAAGVYYEEPTLLHVSRGVSSLEPVRFRCPPELTKLVLQIDPAIVDVPFEEQHGQAS